MRKLVHRFLIWAPPFLITTALASEKVFPGYIHNFRSFQLYFTENLYLLILFVILYILTIFVTRSKENPIKQSEGQEINAMFKKQNINQTHNGIGDNVVNNSINVKRENIELDINTLNEILKKLKSDRNQAVINWSGAKSQSIAIQIVNFLNQKGFPAILGEGAMQITTGSTTPIFIASPNNIVGDVVVDTSLI
jgi:hypothetical protein